MPSIKRNNRSAISSCTGILSPPKTSMSGVSAERTSKKSFHSAKSKSMNHNQSISKHLQAIEECTSKLSGVNKVIKLKHDQVKVPEYEPDIRFRTKFEKKEMDKPKNSQDHVLFLHSDKIKLEHHIEDKYHKSTNHPRKVPEYDTKGMDKQKNPEDQVMFLQKDKVKLHHHIEEKIHKSTSRTYENDEQHNEQIIAKDTLKLGLKFKPLQLKNTKDTQVLPVTEKKTLTKTKNNATAKKRSSVSTKVVRSSSFRLNQKPKPGNKTPEKKQQQAHARFLSSDTHKKGKRPSQVTGNLQKLKSSNTGKQKPARATSTATFTPPSFQVVNNRGFQPPDKVSPANRSPHPLPAKIMTRKFSAKQPPAFDVCPRHAKSLLPPAKQLHQAGDSSAKTDFISNERSFRPKSTAPKTPSRVWGSTPSNAPSYLNPTFASKHASIAEAIVPGEKQPPITPKIFRKKKFNMISFRTASNLTASKGHSAVNKNTQRKNVPSRSQAFKSKPTVKAINKPN